MEPAVGLQWSLQWVSNKSEGCRKRFPDLVFRGSENTFKTEA
jgi:hypothetical protein